VQELPIPQRCQSRVTSLFCVPQALFCAMWE
jgi:hypothetical protein